MKWCKVTVQYTHISKWLKESTWVDVLNLLSTHLVDYLPNIKSLNVCKLHTYERNTEHSELCRSFTTRTVSHLPEQHIILNCKYLDPVKSCSRSLFPFFCWWKQLCCWHTPDVMTPLPTRPNPLPVLNNSALPDVLLADAVQANKGKNHQSKLKGNRTKTPPSKASKPFSEMNREA